MLGTMDRESWLERWQTARIGFHASEVNPHLELHSDRLLGKTPATVFVPLCGKSLDLGWLASRGHAVVGVEIIGLAIEQFWDDVGVTPTVDATAGGHKRFRSAGLGGEQGGSITLLCADIFDLKPADVGSIDAVWDRAAFVALPADVRGRYSAQIQALAPMAPILLNTFTYDTTVMDGPPFSIDDDEVRQWYAGRQIETLSQEDVIDRVPFKERGHSYWTSSVFLIQ